MFKRLFSYLASRSSTGCALRSITGEVSRDDGSIWMSEGYIQGAWDCGRAGDAIDSAPAPASSSSVRER
jgi:hypothetical protein